MYIFDGLLLIIIKKRHFKARILQNLLKNKNCLLIEPQMARNINLIKTGQIAKKWSDKNVGKNNEIIFKKGVNIQANNGTHRICETYS